MSAIGRKPFTRRRLVVVTTVAALVLALAGSASGGSLGSWRGTVGPGSLPLQGDHPTAGNGADPNVDAMGVSSHWNVFNWAPGHPAAVPASYSENIVDSSGRTVKRVFVSTESNPDVGTASSDVNMSFSDDAGQTFLTTERHFPATALDMTRLPDGSLLAIDFIPAWADAAHSHVNLIVRRSKDGGRTWSTSNAPLTMPAEDKLGPMSNGLRVHRRVFVLADGTLIVPAYTLFTGHTTWSSMVLQSSDSGRSWSLRSIIPATTEVGTNEIGMSYTADGRLMAILRTNDTQPHLAQSYSDDDGRTWTNAVDLKGPDGSLVYGIYPDLVLQPNGTLLLSTGRPDVRVLISNDGTGRTWNSQTTVFANYPSTGNNGRFDGTSGNTTMENVGPSRSVLFFDQCHVWGCGAYNEQMGVSAEYVSDVTPGVGRIDVASRLLDKTATVSGTFAKASARFPEMRPAGAFDGSTAPEAEAQLISRHNQPSSMVLTLDRAYSLNRIGLMLGHGDAESATVQLSTDGRTWSAPVVTATDAKDHAMRYTDFSAQAARYVKVTGTVGRTTTVSELELYASDIDTFENEIPFSVPRGWTGSAHATVTDVPSDPAYTEFGGYHSATALRLWDKWTDQDAHITRPFASSKQATASMMWGTSDERARFTIGMRGSGGGTDTTPWQFAIVAGATSTAPQVIQAYDGSTWRTLGTLKAMIPIRTYVPLSISATTSSATLDIDGQQFSTTTPAANVRSFTGLTVTTGAPSEYGGIYFLDDVSVTT